MRWYPLRAKISSLLASLTPEDRKLMLVCLGIAFFFWLLMKLSRDYQAVVAVNIRYELPTDRAFVTPPPATTTAALKGTGWVLLFEFMSSRQLGVSYALPDQGFTLVSSAQLRTEIKRQLANQHLEVELLDFTDTELQLEPRQTRKVPVHFIHQLTFAPEYRLADSITLTPDSVEVSGAESRIKPLVKWPTLPFVRERLRAPLAESIELSPAPPGIVVFPSQVRVDIPVEQLTTKSFFVPVTVENAPIGDSLRIFPDKIKVTCVVGLSDYQAIGPESFTLVVDLANIPLGEGKNTAPIVVKNMPAGLSNLQLSRRSVEFFIIKK